jgi:hypothetical protein
MSKELAVKKERTDIELLLSKAIDKNVSVETLEKLMTMRTQLKQEQAQEEYNRALSEFQQECPTIKKTKNGGETRSGKVAYKYAPLESIVEQVKELIAKHGFSYDIHTTMTEKTVKVFCTINHIGGYSKTNDVEFPLTTKTEIMSAPQVVAATLTYGKRYAFCDGFGILTGDEDNDAIEKKGDKKEDPVTEMMTEKQTPKIENMLKSRYLTEEEKSDLEFKKPFTKAMATTLIEWWYGNENSKDPTIKEGQRKIRERLHPEIEKPKKAQKLSPNPLSEDNTQQEDKTGQGVAEKCPKCGGMMSYVGEGKGVEEYKCMDCGKVIFKEKA